MIQESYVTFEQAKALKELGFPQDSHKDYYDDGGCTSTYERYFKASLSLVQKWLREEKGLYIEAHYHMEYNRHNFSIDNINNHTAGEYTKDYITYEQALSAGIDKCIELLKIII